MIFELYSYCLVVDDEEDAVDTVADGPYVVLSVGPSKVLLAISEGWFEVYTCPPRMGGHGTTVLGSPSSSGLILWRTVSLEDLSSSLEISLISSSANSLYSDLTMLSPLISSLSRRSL